MEEVRGHILVVSEGLTAAILMQVAAEFGLALTIADRIEVVRAAIRSHPPDLIVLDWRWAGALDLMRQLRERAAPVPVVILASAPLPEQVRASAIAVVEHSEVGGRLLPLILAPLERPPQTTATRPDRVPLGIGDASVSVGDHLAWLWEDEAGLSATAKFFRAGLPRGDHFILAGTEASNRLTDTLFREQGVDITALEAQGRLHVIRLDVVNGAVAMVLNAVRSANSRGAQLVRILGHGAGWRALANEQSADEVEAELEQVIASYDCVTICPYRLPAITGRTLFNAALRHHKSIVLNDTIYHSPFYEPPEKGESSYAS